MKKERKPARCWDYAESARNGALFGIAAASLRQVYHAITNQIPDNIPAHVLGCLVAERCWDRVRCAIEEYTWRFDGLRRRVSPRRRM
jgi:hypothetical protein